MTAISTDTVAPSHSVTDSALPERWVRIGTGHGANFATLFGPLAMPSMAPQIEKVRAPVEGR